jgi:hypothetical protein
VANPLTGNVIGKLQVSHNDLVYTPTFETQQESADTRTARWLQRATIGTMGGRSTNAVVSGFDVTFEDVGGLGKQIKLIPAGSAEEE